jgi:hypothetical protein
MDGDWKERRGNWSLVGGQKFGEIPDEISISAQSPLRAQQQQQPPTSLKRPTTTATTTASSSSSSSASLGSRQKQAKTSTVRRKPAKKVIKFDQRQNRLSMQSATGMEAANDRHRIHYAGHN